MSLRRSSGVTLVEITIVVAVVGVMAAMATPNMLRWMEDQKVKTAARAVADAFLLARSEALRTGDNHLVIFNQALTATAPIVIVNDGPPGTANCTIDAGEVIHSVAAEPGVSWGTSTGGANGAVAPDDAGQLPVNVPTGWSFSDAGGVNPATWVLFQANGLPRTFTPGVGVCTDIGTAGAGGGGIYVTNGSRDYAVVLRPLGTARVHRWGTTATGWMN